ncbi:MAG: hypothetical protein ACR2GJ_07135 [Gemmatimonadaceae bacterium]
MALLQPGPDAASRAALRYIQRLIPGVAAVEAGQLSDPSFPRSDPPMLSSAPLLGGGSMRSVQVPGAPEARFAAFLDGTQSVRIVAHHGGVPIVLGIVAAAIRERIDRRLVTWTGCAPRVERRLYLPFAYAPALAFETDSEFGVVNTTEEGSGELPSRHPAALLEAAIKCVRRDRERVESVLAEAWCASSAEPICIDGGIASSRSVAASALAIGVVKSHNTIHAEGLDLDVVLGLQPGERTPPFRIQSGGRSPVSSWYLRLRDSKGHDATWGLVRVEACEAVVADADVDRISRWVLAEAAPLALPDSRWDKMSYGVRNSEEFLRAIA